MQELDIGELSTVVGLSASAIRFYESKGLIQSIGRHGLRRQYHSSVVQTLSLIKILKQGGLSLKEISAGFVNHGKIKIERQFIASEKQHIKEKIQNLNQLLIVLNHLEHCPYTDHLECPDFKKMLMD